MHTSENTPAVRALAWTCRVDASYSRLQTSSERTKKAPSQLRRCRPPIPEFPAAVQIVAFAVMKGSLRGPCFTTAGLSGQIPQSGHFCDHQTPQTTLSLMGTWAATKAGQLAAQFHADGGRWRRVEDLPSLPLLVPPELCLHPKIPRSSESPTTTLLRHDRPPLASSS
jgi:hypothetical protein